MKIDPYPKKSRLKISIAILGLGLASWGLTSTSYGADGYGANAAGGAGGSTVTVTTLAAYVSNVTASGPRIVQISGTITGLDNSTGQNVAPYKTIQGTGSAPTVDQCIRLYPSDHIIIQNLKIKQTADEASNGGDGNDGITIKQGAHDIYITHCTITDPADGAIDITAASDNVTISWCKFLYTFDHEHNFCNLIGAADTDTGPYHITFHHNWWSTLCNERMPAERFGSCHMYNNYFTCTGNSYCSNVRLTGQMLSENNYYDHVNSPLYKDPGTGMKIHVNGNIYVSTTGNAPDPGTDTVFTPPYSYTVDPTANVPSIVSAGAGCPL